MPDWPRTKRCEAGVPVPHNEEVKVQSSIPVTRPPSDRTPRIDETPPAAEPTGSPIQRAFRRYAGNTDRPLAGYGALLGAYVAFVGAGFGLLRSRGARLPRQVPVRDLALLSVACFRATRLVSKDSITSVVRSPFTVYDNAAGEGEVNEEVIGTGLRHAVGELVTCPFCLTLWTSTLAMFGLLVAPRVTRWLASVLAVATGSDFLQLAYATARHSADR